MTNTCFHHSLPIYFFNISNICHKFTSIKSRIALQVARKIAPCDRTLSMTKIDFISKITCKKTNIVKTTTLELGPPVIVSDVVMTV